MRVAVIGLGLIGGSLALAATARGDQVVATDRDETAGEIGLDRGAIARFEPTIGQALEAAPSGCAVSDVGSTKGRLVAQVGSNPQFVGGHPVCGSEARGVANARPELFDGATWFLTPVAATDPSAHRRLHTFVSSLGARPVAIDPDAHDRLVALTSHLPHALANVLVNQAGAGKVDGHDPLAAV